ncbi:1446_t:CDS:2 [Paraglomus occultum]|uniref:1446_t:CDS:1 n=1 Tax=Paraglomus occultum TaxID=144539 RepID=A0A9N8VQP9_9GLOM|nr:1446_t:CDS:2 [Paraglomus occultum]
MIKITEMAEQTAEIKRLKKSEEQLEDLKKKVVEIMLEYYEPRHYGTAEEIVNNDNSRTKELVAEIKTNEQIKEVISLIIDS